MGGINWNPERAVITLCTLFTVDTSCVVLTANADTPAGIDALSVQALLALLHTRVIVAVDGVAVAVAGFTLIALAPGSRPPASLIVPHAAAVTRLSTGVVLAFAPEQLFRIIYTAYFSMAIANTPSTNADILYAVVIPPRDGRIPLGFGDEVTQEGVGAEETQADVCGLGKLPQRGRESKIFGTWTTVYQGDHDLTVFQRHDPGIFSSTEYIVIPRDSCIGLLSKLFQTVSFRMSKKLPR